MPRLMTILLTSVVLVMPLDFVFGDDTQDDQVDYLRDIKPILTQHCTSCHGRTKQQNGLRLDTAETSRNGGDSGPSIVAGKADESLLISAVMGDGDVERMPPEGPPLSGDEVALLKRWIDQGAKALKEEIPPVIRPDHWAFKKPVSSSLPECDQPGRSLSPIDRFVHAKLDEEGLAAAAEADRATLIRRLSLDLRGFPPSVGEVEQFVRDDRPDAFERLVDRLLASAAYGERWGRHWLDIARYADSNGFTRDFGRQIWKYREWVIEAVNADMAFDQFTVEQFAGDMLPGATLSQKIATGFHRNTLINEEGGTDQEQFRVDAVADRVVTTGVAYLGLTLGCARCHEHKYDPISQREYYQLFAFLNNCDEPKIDAPSAWQIARGDLDRRTAIRKEIADIEKQISEMEDEFLAAQFAWEKTITPEQRARLAGPLQAALQVNAEKRSDAEKKLVKDHYKKTADARKKFPMVDKIGELRGSEPVIPTTMVLKQRGKPRETHVHRRGNFLDLGVKVEPKVLEALHPLDEDVEQPTRLDFARWLVDTDNPLTARVVMNRHWQTLFGRGIVETENDFGIQGIPPTHPQLLDRLAIEFMQRQWSAKAMHRWIVTSSTYRQSSNVTPEFLARDPYNRLLARQARFRLEAEIVRDAALEAGGLLTHKIGGPSVYPPQPEGVFQFTQDPKPWKTTADEDRYRRGMYTHFWRSSPYPALMAFDFPKSNTTCTRRVRSNTPIQALVLANDVQFVECARALAIRSFGDGSNDWSPKIDRLYRIALSRTPSDDERVRVAQFLKDQLLAYRQTPQLAEQLVGEKPKGVPTLQLAAWTALCRVLINLDEFVTRE